MEKFREYILKIFELYGYNRSLELSMSVDMDSNCIPWYTYPAIEYLSSLDFRDSIIFEFGSGSSSIWWSKKAKEVYSVESNEQWFNKISEMKSENNHIFLRENSQAYSECIVEQGKIFDVVVIDGKRRLECIEKSLDYLSDKGILIFDNSDRCLIFNHYKKALKRLNEEDFIQVDFKGFTPLNAYTSTTSIFFRRAFNLSNRDYMQASKAIGSFNPNKKKGGRVDL